MDIYLSAILEEVDGYIECGKRWFKNEPIYKELIQFKRDGTKAFHDSDEELMEKLVDRWSTVTVTHIGDTTIWSSNGLPIKKVDGDTFIYDRYGNFIQRY